MQENPNSPHLPGIDASQANDESVIRVHAQIRRTPIAGSPVAFFTAIALIIVFVFGWFYVRRYFAGLDTKSYVADREQIAALNAYMNRPKEPAGPVVIDGAKVFAQNCAACHQAEGQGLAGAFPPLAGSEWAQADAGVPIRIVLAGLGGPINVEGTTYNGAMPAFGAAFDDATIAAVLTHVRSSWGNQASEVTAEQVAAIRAEIGSRGAWTADELQEFMKK